MNDMILSASENKTIPSDPAAEKTYTETVYVSMLGRFEIRSGEGEISDSANRSMKMWNFLAYIITHRNRKIPHEEFYEILWNGEDNDNPLSALKTLLYRVRTLLEPVDKNGDFIVSQRGCYCFNPKVRIILDIEQFEKLCRRASASGVGDDEKTELLTMAVKLYKGGFLNRMSTAMWVAPLQTRYHSIYLAAAHKLTSMLIESNQFDAAAEFCSRALQIDSMDEKLYCALIKAKLLSGDEEGALKQYKIATDLLYRSLGVRPSDELRDLYTEIMKKQKNQEMDLSAIMDDLRESASVGRAFYCEYSFFREVYRLEARRVSRIGLPVFIGLVTIDPDKSKKTIPPQTLTLVMDKLQTRILNSLRRGDVVSRYSSTQFVLLLSALTFEDGEKVVARILSAFGREVHYNWLRVGFKIQEIELTD